jgi:hypothetical protein
MPTQMALYNHDARHTGTSPMRAPGPFRIENLRRHILARRKQNGVRCSARLKHRCGQFPSWNITSIVVIVSTGCSFNFAGS